MDAIRSGGGGAAVATGPSAAPTHNGARDAVGCAHLLCPEPATALLLFDPRVATAWLVDLEGEAWHGLPMCPKHADRFRPPVGWVLSDQRSRTDRQLHGAEGSPAPQPAARHAEPDADPLPVPEPVPTPLLSRAFRTTAQVSN